MRIFSQLIVMAMLITAKVSARPVRPLSWKEGTLLVVDPQAHSLKLRDGTSHEVTIYYTDRTRQWNYPGTQVRDPGSRLNASSLAAGDVLMVAGKSSNARFVADRIIVKTHGKEITARPPLQ